MAEGTYEYECMRAELLGIDKPDYEQFVKDKEMKENERNDVEEAEQDTENLKVSFNRVYLIFVCKETNRALFLLTGMRSRR